MRLSLSALGALPAEVARPAYDRREVQTGVVHLGVGAFHRAHQAAVFDRLLARGDRRWGVLGAALRSPTAAEQLNAQDGLFTLEVREGEARSRQVIGSLSSVLVAPADPPALVQAMAAPDVHLVTLTVTEKAYRPAPDDLDRPTTAAGFIAAALRRRRREGLRPFTAISCDNLSGNGAKLRALVLALARDTDPGLADWIEGEGAFPETMVDRIVPATSPDDIAALEKACGYRDLAMVKTEPFLQWVIEDRFSGERPEFASAGAQVTRDVRPWEQAKLRLLNGAHSAIAYIGGLAGIEFVHQFVARPQGVAFVEGLWDEAASTLDPPPELDLAAYRAALMHRFRNEALQHRTRQIALDGSQKLPQRLVEPLVQRIQQGRSCDHLAFAVAAWMRWQRGVDDAGRPHPVEDPLAATTAGLIRAAGSPAEQVRALLGLRAIFPPWLVNHEGLVRLLAAAMETPSRWPSGAITG